MQKTTTKLFSRLATIAGAALLTAAFATTGCEKKEAPDTTVVGEWAEEQAEETHEGSEAPPAVTPGEGDEAAEETAEEPTAEGSAEHTGEPAGSGETHDD